MTQNEGSLSDAKLLQNEAIVLKYLIDFIKVKIMTDNNTDIDLKDSTQIFSRLQRDIRERVRNHKATKDEQL